VSARRQHKRPGIAVNASTAIDRRRFLIGAGGAALALPLLDAFAPRRSWAQSAANTRFVVVMHGQGTMNGSGNDRWTPAGTGTGFALSPLLEPLSAHKDQLTVISGIDNAVAPMMGGNGHNRAGRSLLTAETFSGGGENGNANGPSIDQVIAERIGGGSQYRSVAL
jgi:hypothetical protein